MTELMKRYEAETGEKAKKKVLVMYSTKRYGWGREKNHLFFTNKFVKWFKDKYDELKTEVLDVEIIERFQEIIRNQCDEISALKDQLRWRPVSEKPENEDVYFAEVKSHTGCESTIIAIAYFDGKLFPWHDVVKWLPIPPQGE